MTAVMEMKSVGSTVMTGRHRLKSWEVVWPAAITTGKLSTE
jgi:hypothetical protein